MDTTGSSDKEDGECSDQCDCGDAEFCECCYDQATNYCGQDVCLEDDCEFCQDDHFEDHAEGCKFRGRDDLAKIPECHHCGRSDCSNVCLKAQGIEGPGSGEGLKGPDAIVFAFNLACREHGMPPRGTRYCESCGIDGTPPIVDGLCPACKAERDNKKGYRGLQGVEADTYAAGLAWCENNLHFPNRCDCCGPFGRPPIVDGLCPACKVECDNKMV